LSGRGWQVAHLDELEPVASDLVEGEWLPVRHHFGIGAVGVNAYRGDPGQLVIEEHAESEATELYFVAEGRARFELDGETIDARAGTLVWCGEPETVRAAVAEEPGTVVLAFGAVPGRGFGVSDWESSRTSG
jgi:quercetin dioxygenase-like cupin family protein